jgi:ribose 1,5-bisphosphate isomerase
MKVNPRIKKMLRDIETLKIQGARNVAKAVLEILRIHIKNSKSKNKVELMNELAQLVDHVLQIRPTEPMVMNEVRDMLSFAMMEISAHPSLPMNMLKKALLEEIEQFEERWRKNKEQLAIYGARIVQDGMTVLTYCHSSTVTSVLKTAFDQGKEFNVVCFETRPMFQGRITAKELAKHGINTTLVVDGAMNVYMKKAHLVLVGADAITAVGDLVNKIGTSTLAHIARMHDVSFYSCAELYKYEPLTFFGKRIKIEQRKKEEVWDDAPAYINVENYAFDITPARFINGFITEIGIIPPQGLWSVAMHRFGFNVEVKR